MTQFAATLSASVDPIFGGLWLALGSFCASSTGLSRNGVGALGLASCTWVQT